MLLKNKLQFNILKYRRNFITCNENSGAMKRLYSTYLLLLSCASLSAQATEKCTQLPMPDVLAKMIVESVSLDEYNSDADCYDIQFRECNTLADLLGRGQDEEAGYPVEELINQLETSGSGYIFYSDLGDDAHKSPRHFMRKKRVKLPARVVSVCISSSTEGEVSILCYPQTYVRRRRVWVSGDLANEHIWVYDTTLRRYNLRQIDDDYLDGSISVDAPVSFYDVLKHISDREYRHIDVRYGDERDVFDMQRPMYLGTKMNREHYMRLAIAVDELGLVNYQSDTICIRYSYSQWNMSGNIYTNPYSRYSLNFKCNKGLYWLEDYRLEPVVCDEEERKNDEIVRQKYFPERDALPFSYDWAMIRYTCWDDKKMLRNFGPISDYFESLIRIIIKDGRVVYCDSWDW